MEVPSLLMKLGYQKNGIAAMWFKSPTESIEDGLKMLRTDKDALELAKIGLRDEMVELYVVHKSGFCRRSCTIEEIEVEDVVGLCKGGVGRAGLEEGSNGKAQKLMMGKSGIKATEIPIGDTSDGPVESSESRSDDDSQDEDFEPTSDGSYNEEPWSDTKSEDSAHDIVFDDSDDEGNVGGGLFDVEVKGLDEEENVLPEHHGQATSTVNKGKDVVVAGFRDEDDGYDSEELPDLPSSDEEGDVPLKKYLLHKDLKNMSEYKWEVCTLYLSRDQFKDCVISVAVHSGRGLSFKKCDDRRVKVTKIGIIHAKWLSKAFIRRIAEDPNVKLATLVKKTHTKWNVDLTLSKAARVKHKCYLKEKEASNSKFRFGIN
ncbi:hypothetical protein PIB30_035811 [Stylosanthes scabra]|uniref:PB1-like domain-containing protein n=1 Tax=Stylosanthes scabra TaxID=79078 RepID=A0ABU6XBM8_9FABA|nr:hypothetical protein [Stylosanthes scabra]